MQIKVMANYFTINPYFSYNVIINNLMYEMEHPDDFAMGLYPEQFLWNYDQQFNIELLALLCRNNHT